MRSTFLFIGAFFLSILCVKAQVKKISGKVVDSLNNPIEIFDVRVLRADSSMLIGGTFLEGSFEIELPEESSLVKVSSLGYVPAYISFDSKKEDNIINIGSIILKDSSTELDEVVVSARRPLARLSGDSYIVDVSKTYLAEVGTFIDIARRVPGIIVSAQGGIGVMGKPRVLININGRAIRSMSELQTLQSNRIKSISVDRNPSTMYSSNYDAIINIVTTDAIQDYLHIIVADQLSISRELSNHSSLTLNANSKSFAFFTDVNYSSNGQHQYDTEKKQIWTKTKELNTVRSSNLRNRNSPLGLNQIIEYRFRPQTVLGVGYQFSITNTNLEKTQDFTMTFRETSQSMPVETQTSMRRVEHNPTVYFTHKGKNSRLGLYTDYYTASLRSRQHSIENQHNTVFQDFKDRYDVMGLKADYSQVLQFLTYSVGAKATYIKDLGTYLTGLGDNTNSRRESYSFATYLNLSKSIGHFFFATGLRYERERAKSFKSLDNMSDMTYNHLFPYFAISYRGDMNGSLSYSRRIYQPTYNQLIAKSVYIDPLSYSIGNPLLKSNLVDIVSASIQKGAFSGSISYEHSLNKKVQIAILEEEPQTARVRFTYDNIPHVHSLTAYAMCNYGVGCLRGNSTLMLSSSHMTYQGKTYSTFKDIGLYIKTTLEVSLWKGASSMLSASYRNAQYQDFYRIEPSFNTSLYLTQNLFQNKLKISLIAEDPLKTSRVNNWIQTMQQARIEMNTDADSRFIGISIRYTFGRSKDKAQSKSSIQEEIKRL